MKRIIRPFLALAALLLAVGLTGCADGLTGVDEAPGPVQSRQQGKLRHAHLLDRAVRPAPATTGFDKDGTALQTEATTDSTVGLIIGTAEGIDPYKLFRRYEYEQVFDGLAGDVERARLDSVLEAMQLDPDILWIEPDAGVDDGAYLLEVLAGNAQGTPWGHERIGALDAPEVRDVDLFLLDTGTYTDDLNVTEQLAFTETASPADLEGHGYHLAGLMAAIDDGDGIVGVAPSAPVRSLKVLNESGTSTVADVVAALEYLVGQKQANPNRPMVANLSFGLDLGTPAYNALDLAVEAAIGTGVVVVAAAGNDGVDAATISPAHVPEVITVGAYDPNDQFAAFSNYGPVVDILAPGVDILSLATDALGRPALAVMSGTSMAAAYVSGAVAQFLQANPHASPAQVHDAVTHSGLATVLGVPSGTTNRTVYLGRMDNSGSGSQEATGTGLAGVAVPPFFQYAVTSGGTIWIGDQVTAAAPAGTRRNASVFANGKIDLYGRGSHIEGFGYYSRKMRVTDAEEAIFQPRYNPTELPSLQQVDELDVPALPMSDLRRKATRITEGDLVLSGHYELGTQENPLIWYVSGQLHTDGPVSFSGYGILLVEKHATFYHDVATTEATDASTLALYTGGQVTFNGPVSLAAQLFVDDHVTFWTPGAKIRGSITATGDVTLDRVTIEYRPASPALTEPIWGTSSTDAAAYTSSEAPADTTSPSGSRGKKK